MTFSLSHQIPALQLEVIYQPGASLQVHRKQTQTLSHALLCFTIKASVHVCVKQKMSRLRGVLCPICVCSLRYNPQKMSLEIPARLWDLMLEKVCNDHTVQLSCVFLLQSKFAFFNILKEKESLNSTWTFSRFSDSNMPPECFGSCPVPRWWKCWFTGVIIWLCRRSNKHWGSRFWPRWGSPRQVRFYSELWSILGQLVSGSLLYKVRAFLWETIKLPRIFFLSFIYLMRPALKFQSGAVIF